MLLAIYAFAGSAIMFFGYDNAVMSQVNTNNNYLQTMGFLGGTARDNVALGGMVSLWFGGFAIGKRSSTPPIRRPDMLTLNRRNCYRIHRGLDRSSENNPAWMSMGHVGRGYVGLLPEHCLARLCPST